MQKDDIMLKVENVSKIYKLGEIGGTTLRDELQRLSAKLMRKPDPTKKVGAKNYAKGEKFKALDDVSFEIKKGERIGIIGHNGAGKSTLLKLISRVTGPSNGAIYLNGKVASMLEVGTGFHPELTGRENIYMNGAILGMTKKEIDTKMEDIIEFSEVGQFIDTPVKRYSSGMYVKLAFSVAAHLDSEIVIMDEVLAVGDVQFQQKCLKKMREISEKNAKTILYVSHNMFTIRELCERVLVLKEGKLIFDGPVDEGINFYNNKTSNKIVEYDLTNQKRCGSTLDSFRIERALFTEGTNLVDDRKQSISFSIHINNRTVIENAYFFITIINSSNYPVGTFYSDLKNYSVKNYDEKFELNVGFLSPGSYSIKIEVFQNLKSGSRIRLDMVDSILHFDVFKEYQSFDIMWKSNYWGSIALPVTKHSSNSKD